MANGRHEADPSILGRAEENMEYKRIQSVHISL